MKLTTDEILKRFNNFHNNFYKYELKYHKDINDTIEIICPEHGKFNQKISVHFKHGCSKCANIKLANIKRGDINEYLEKCKIKHNNKYDYSKVIFTKLKDKVEIICPKHGSFFCNLDNHMNKGTGCKKCRKYKKFIFIPPNNDYDYSKAIYTNSKDKIEIICSEHGSFFQIANNNLNKKQTCYKCSLKVKSDKLIYSLEYYLPILNEKHNNKYDYSKFIYLGFKEKSIIICPKHGDFNQSICQNLKGGCPVCSESNGERIIRNFLIDNNIIFKTQRKYEDCKNIRVINNIGKCDFCQIW